VTGPSQTVAGDADRGASLEKTPQPSGKPTTALPLLGRMVRYARPYLTLVIAALFFALLFAAARYGRAYLVKPLMDDVLLPHRSGVEADVGDDFRSLETYSLAAGRAPASATAAELRDSGIEAPAAPATPDSHPADVAGEKSTYTEEVSAAIRMVLLAALLIVLAMPLALFARAYLLQYVLGAISVDIKKQLAAKLLSLPLTYHRTTHSGDILSRTMNDATAAENALRLLFVDFLQAAIMVVIGAGTLVLISWQLALIALLSAPLIVGVLAFFSKKVRRTATRRQEQLGEVTQRLVAILSGIKVIKAFRGEDMENQAFRRETDKLFKRVMKVVKNRVLSRSLVEMLNNAMGMGLLLLGTLLVLENRWGLTPGDLVAFTMVLATTYKPIKAMSKGWVGLMDSLASAERFFHILDTPAVVPDPPGAVEIDGVHESIRFENVHFSYGREQVLCGVSVEAKPNEVVAIVGRTGTGKTTMMDLLLRFEEPDAGSIEIDGVSLDQITRDSFLDQIAVVTQEPFLFDATICQNIRYGRPDADDEAFAAAVRAAHVDEFVDQLPEGYDTPVGEFGVMLSGGQRQRITIARAILKNPSILVFDEATSSLDAKTERAVQEAIDSLRGKRTIFVIAHRLSTIRNADHIVVLEGGRISHEGDHYELMERSVLYRDLVSLQTEQAEPHELG
jgi:subfamily B ATP-binding cassette protein MsbA